MAGILSDKTAYTRKLHPAKSPPVLTVLVDEDKYTTVIFITSSGRCLFEEAEAVTREYEFLEHTLLCFKPFFHTPP